MYGKRWPIFCFKWSHFLRGFPKSENRLRVSRVLTCGGSDTQEPVVRNKLSRAKTTNRGINNLSTQMDCGIWRAVGCWYYAVLCYEVDFYWNIFGTPAGLMKKTSDVKPKNILLNSFPAVNHGRYKLTLNVPQNILRNGPQFWVS